MAIELANKHPIPLVLANDPDADRFCAAERTKNGSWHIFTGNEMGIILAYHILGRKDNESYISNDQRNLTQIISN